MSLLAVSCVMAALAQLPASPDVRPIPVSGVVVDAAGAPARDAEIWLIRANRPEEDRKSGMALSWARQLVEDGQDRMLAHARTDASGRFRLDVPGEIAARPDPVSLAVWATHRGEAAAVDAPAAGGPARRPAADAGPRHARANRAHDRGSGWSARGRGPGRAFPGGGDAGTRDFRPGIRPHDGLSRAGRLPGTGPGGNGRDACRVERARGAAGRSQGDQGPGPARPGGPGRRPADRAEGFGADHRGQGPGPFEGRRLRGSGLAVRPRPTAIPRADSRSPRSPRACSHGTPVRS